MFSFSLVYLWWIVAVLLIAGEVLAPGFFLLWIGLAAGLMGLTVLAAPLMGFLTQIIVFSLYTFASCYVYARWLRPRVERADPGAEGLNQRGARMVGMLYVLSEPIVNGRGKALVGDGQWLVTGKDMPQGTQVIVRGLDGTTLQVEEVGLIAEKPTA